jgi:predicted RNA-binding Zn ribbon-like protein
MAEKVRNVGPETIKLQGGRLSLDFANSVDWTAEHEPVAVEEAITTPDELIRWGVRLGIPSGEAPDEELAAALDLREALHLAFAAIAHGEDPPPGTLELIARDHAQAAGAAHLAPSDGAFVLEWPEDDPRRVRFAVVVDAVALLADPERLARVRQCPGRNCGWLFLDVSGRRHWCSMATCGSRAKMRRLYARRRGA